METQASNIHPIFPRSVPDLNQSLLTLDTLGDGGTDSNLRTKMENIFLKLFDPYFTFQIYINLNLNLNLKTKFSLRGEEG